MRRSGSFIIWLLLAIAGAAVSLSSGQNPEATSGGVTIDITVNGKALAVAPGQRPRHDPATCRACNVGTQRQPTADVGGSQ